jgi:hypothetical protein
MPIDTPYQSRGLVSLCAVLCLLLPGNAALAMWAGVSEAELIAHSHMIVVGTLVEKVHTRLGPNQSELEIGVLRVEQVLKPSTDGGTSSVAFVLLALPRSGGFVSSASIQYSVGQQGLWFLAATTNPGSGLYNANHPQRFVTMAKAAPVIKRVQAALVE